MSSFKFLSHICKNFYQKPLFCQPSWILAAILIFFYFLFCCILMKKTKLYYFSNFKTNVLTFHYIYVRNSIKMPFFCRPFWILAAILNCPRMPIWHHPDFKSGYPYQLNSAKTFSIDAIARSSWVHAGLHQNFLGL